MTCAVGQGLQIKACTAYLSVGAWCLEPQLLAHSFSDAYQVGVLTQVVSVHKQSFGKRLIFRRT